MGHSAAMSGAEIALTRLLPVLDADPTVLLAEDGPIVERLRSVGVDVRVVPLPAALAGFRRTSSVMGAVRSLGLFIAFLRETRGAVRASGAALVHTNSMKAHLYGGLVGRSLGLPVVWHVRDRLASDYLGRTSAVVMRVMARLLPTIVIATSASTAATVGRSDVAVVGDSQPFRRGAPTDVEVPAVRDEIRRIGIVGRLAEWKGQHVLLEALSRPGAPEVEACLIGSAMFDDGEYERRLRSLAAGRTESGKVEFRGHREDVLAEMQALDVVVHASTIAEPFGQVVIEAMAAGVPVVASDRGGPSEVITSGVDGLLVPPGDRDALIDALHALAEPAVRSRLRDAALHTASRYTPERTASGVRAAYDRALGRVDDRRRRSGTTNPRTSR